MPTIVRYASGTAVLYPERLFDDQSVVGRWTEVIATELESNAIIKAPKRSGALAESISARDFRSGSTARGITLHVDADHARYVIFGTVGPIEPASGIFRLPPYGIYGWVLATQVAGQDANDFIQDSIDIVAASHPSIAGARVVGVEDIDSY